MEVTVGHEGLWVLKVSRGHHLTRALHLQKFSNLDLGQYLQMRLNRDLKESIIKLKECIYHIT